MKINTMLSCFLAFAGLNSYINAASYLSDDDINEIYETFVKPHYTYEYANRYVPLPLHKNNLSWRWEDKDLPRVLALLEFERFIVEHNVHCNKGLAINGFDPEWNYLKHNHVLTIEYTDDPEKYDLHRLDLPEKDFDFVMVNQTLEHVYDPLGCLKNIYNHMAEDGILYFNVPANNIPHSLPWHYYTGFTSVGIGALVKLAGFTILSIGQWGNVDYMKKLFEMNYWPDYRQFKNPGYNDIKCPVITWVFAKK